MSQRLRVLAIVGCLLIAWNRSSAEEPDDGFRPRTNVLILNVDTVGEADLSCYGSREISTPHIDALAREGLQFQHGYAAAAFDVPARIGWLTGRAPQHMGIEFDWPANPDTLPQPGFPADAFSLGEAFQRAGYRTMAVGKWHLGTAPAFHPRHHGFDEFFGFLGGRRSNLPLIGNEPSPAERLDLNGVAVPETAVSNLNADIGQAAAEFILETIPYPWLLCVSFNVSGVDGTVPPPHLDEFNTLEPRARRIFAAEVRAVDNAVGRILSAMNEVQQQGNTLVILVGSHGGAVETQSTSTSHRGSSGSLWEGGLRIPLIMRFPGVIPAGAKSTAPASAFDLFPTALAAVGADLPANKLDGVSLLPNQPGTLPDIPSRALFWRQGNASAVRRGDRKLIRVDGKPTALFNLRLDSHEKTNQLEMHPDVAANLAAELDRWEQSLTPPLWLETAEQSERNRQIHRFSE